MKNKKSIAIIASLFILLVATSIYLFTLVSPEEVVLIDIDSKDVFESEAKLLETLVGADRKYKNLIDLDLNGINDETISKYKIEAAFEESDMTIMANQTINYTNTEATDLDTVQLHVFTNAFKRKETSPTTLSAMSYAYPKGFSSGYTEFDSILVNGQEVEYEIKGIDDTTLLLYLNESLKHNEKIDIEMQYMIQIPNCRDRFGYDERTVQIANWYPTIAVYENGAWNDNPYYNVGDPFYTETSSYDVTIDVPNDYIVASTGVKEEIYVDNNDRKIYEISSDFTRDFALVMSKYFAIDSKLVDGTRITTYTYSDDGDDVNEALESGARTIESFNKMFGKYPYTDLAIVETSFPSGMEYPQLIMIGNSYYVDGFEVSLDGVINHEIGHQWWYGLVGNNQINESWLDEGLTSYSELLYEEYFDSNDYTDEVVKMRRKVSKGNKRFKDGLVVKPLSEFEDWSDYGFLAYNKSQMFFIDYRSKYGKEKLMEALKLHFEKNKYRVTSSKDIISTFEEISGEDISDITSEVLFDDK